MNFSVFQIPNGSFHRLRLQKVVGIDLDQHFPLQDPVDQGLIVEMLHKPVHMSDHRAAAQVLPQLCDLVQHGVAPGHHGRLHQNGAAAADSEHTNVLCLGNAGEIQDLRPKDNDGVGLRPGGHGISQPKKGLVPAVYKVLGVLLIGIKVAGGHHHIYPLAEALVQHLQALLHALRAVIHLRENMTVIVDHRDPPEGRFLTFSSNKQTGPKAGPLCSLTW